MVFCLGLLYFFFASCFGLFMPGDYVVLTVDYVANQTASITHAGKLYPRKRSSTGIAI